jgi:hypothetical protein
MTDTRKNDTYHAARRVAQERADLSGRDIGLEWLGSGPIGHWHVFALPNPENRYGYELKCELVHPRRRCGCAELWCW